MRELSTFLISSFPKDQENSLVMLMAKCHLECEVKWALGSIAMNKASGGDGIPAELFQILKDDTVKSPALNMPANLEDSAMATGLERSLSFEYQRTVMPKNIQITDCAITFISRVSKVMLKILQARL